jgi:hypothetical protein
MLAAVEHLLLPVGWKLRDFALQNLIERTGPDQEMYFYEPARRDLFRAEALNAVVAEHLEQLIFLIEIHRHPQTDIGRIPPYNDIPSFRIQLRVPRDV